MVLCLYGALASGISHSHVMSAGRPLHLCHSLHTRRGQHAQRHRGVVRERISALSWVALCATSYVFTSVAGLSMVCGKHNRSTQLNVSPKHLDHDNGRTSRAREAVCGSTVGVCKTTTSIWYRVFQLSRPQPYIGNYLGPKLAGRLQGQTTGACLGPQIVGCRARGFYIWGLAPSFRQLNTCWYSVTPE